MYVQFGFLYGHVVAFYTDLIGKIRGPGAYVESPAVPGTRNHDIIQFAHGNRSVAVRATIVDGVKRSTQIV